MQITRRSPLRRTPPRELTTPSIPYCYVLDEQYRVVMAGPAECPDPLAAYYDVHAAPEMLPEAIDGVVRSVTQSWSSTRAPETISMSLAEFEVAVSPLHGEGGRRMAVFVQRTPV